ncbi:MAG: hypothetical protein OXT65_01515, partial [Alphaproteobacteria bacterium]|nr:hypothetical protein [Alphaproteobacteria bacterium]
MQAADKRTAKLLCDEAMDLIRTQNLEEAEKRVKESLKIEETSEAYRHLAVISAARRDADASMSYLEQALETNIDDDIALALMAEALLESGDTMQAIGHYMLAIKAKPDELRYKQRFVALAGHVPFAQYNPHVEEVLLICLNTPDLDCTKAQSIWYTTLYN